MLLTPMIIAIAESAIGEYGLFYGLKAASAMRRLVVIAVYLRFFPY
jgi:hypothetical protein